MDDVDCPRKVVDTVLAKLYAQFGKKTELYALIQDQNYIVLSEVEDYLIQARQVNVLCQLYKQHGEDNKLLDLYSKSVSFELSFENLGLNFC